VKLLKGLQTTGQTGFYVAYEDLHDVDVMNGLARFLGCNHKIKSLNKKLKKQNPAPMSSKVANFDDMTDALARMEALVGAAGWQAVDYEVRAGDIARLAKGKHRSP